MLEHEEAREISSLYLDYIAWWGSTSNTEARRQLGPYRAPAANTKNLAALRAMVTWCREQNVDPRVWLYLLFSVRAWRFAPQLVSSHLCSPKWLEQYEKRKRSIAQAPRYKARSVFAKATLASEAFDPRLHIDAGAESRKLQHRMAHAQAQCMAEMDELTYGWHPQSVHCQSCPAATQCAELLDLRIGYALSSVRAGKATLQGLGQ